MSSLLTHNPRGSVWHRWDPHLHAPGIVKRAEQIFRFREFSKLFIFGQISDFGGIVEKWIL
jgi:hypothetical protein